MTKPVTAITAWGAASSGTIPELDANFAAIKTAINDLNTYQNYIADTGAANAYAVTLPANITGALTTGLQVQFKATNANTGASTFNYNGGGAVNITRLNGTALVAGDIPANGIVIVQYDGTSWLLQSPYSLTVIQPSLRNYIINGSFAIKTRATPTTDNAYCVDRWRLLLGAANAATFVQDTADVPTGARYASKLIVGAGNNNKFGIFYSMDNLNCSQLAGQTVSILVPLKATAALVNGTGKIRIGIMQWTGTADAISATPIAAWGAEGTNPTLIAGWAFVNTPAALSVTTAWADYSVVNQALSASLTNLGVLIWSDDTANTQTTDILRVGGYVTLCVIASAPTMQVAPWQDERDLCDFYARSSFPAGTAPAQNAGVAGAVRHIQVTAGGAEGLAVNWQRPMRSTPTVVLYNPSATNALVRDTTAAADWASSTLGNQGVNGFTVTGTSAGSAGDVAGVHYLATADL